MITFFADNQWLLWLIVSFICLIIELGSGDLYMLCLAIGALFSMMVAATDAPIWLQIVVFAIASVLTIAFIRPPLLRRLHSGEERKSNADALIGCRCHVIDTIPANGYGYVKIDGDEWRSKSIDAQRIERGTEVEVVERDSIVLTVKPVQ